MKERVQGCEENDQQYNSMQEELLGQINIIEEIKEDTEQATNVSVDLKELLKELKKKKKLDCLSVLYLLPFTKLNNETLCMFDFALNKKGRFDWFVAKLVDVLSSTSYILHISTHKMSKLCY